jgi:hypothetical protein
MKAEAMDGLQSGAGGYHVDASAATGVAIGDRARVIQKIRVFNIHPATENRPRLTATLKNRFRTLLGERHALFGGRVAALGRLDGFLTGRPSGYLFVTGGAGFGKTALLANWVNGLLQRNLEVCYHFISPQDHAADERFAVRSLCQQLAAFHELTGELPADSEELRQLYTELLGLPPAEGRQLVVVLDALDEAAGWTPGPDLFPRPLPPRVFVIFSAREAAKPDWLKVLNLAGGNAEVLPLRGLDGAEVVALLRAAGGRATAWAEDRAFVALLRDKSGGDPFHLHALVKDILEPRTASGDSPEPRITSLADLEKEPSGLDEYLRQWWEEVSRVTGEQAVQDLLGYLVVSRNGLTRDDLINLSDTDALNGTNLDRTIGLVARYVVGGDRAGYALAHPRFKAFVAVQKVTESDQRRYRDLLIRYCGRWPRQKIPYAIGHYAVHLAEAGLLEELHALVSGGEEGIPWADEHFRMEGSHAGYLRDLDLAWTRAEDTGPTGAARRVRYALIKSSIRSRTDKLTPELVGNLIGAGVWDHGTALAHVDHIPNELQRSAAVVSIAGLLSEKDLLAAWSIAKEIADQGHSSAALLGLAPYLPAELKGRLLDDLGAVENEWTRAGSLWKVIRHLSPGLEREALAKAVAIQNETARASLICSLVGHLPAGLQEEALSAVSEIKDERVRAGALSRLVMLLPDGLRLMAYAGVAEIQSEVLRAKALNGLAEHFPGPIRFGMLTRLSDLDGARRSPLALAEVLLELRGYLHEEDRKALREWMVDLNKSLAGYGWEEPDEHAEAAIRFEGEFARVLEVVPNALPGDLKEKVLDAARSKEAARYLTALGLLGVPESLPPSLQPEALEAIRSIGDGVARVHALAGILRYLEGTTRDKVARAALALVPEVADERRRAEVLCRLAPRLPDELRADAWAVATGIRNDGRRAVAVRALLNRWPDAAAGSGLGQGTAPKEQAGLAERLRELVPQLPPPLQADAAVAVQEVDAQQAPGEALGRLAKALPDAIRQAILEGPSVAALLATMTLPFEVMVELMEYQPPKIRGALVDMKDALGSLGAIEGHSQARAAALSRLADCLPDNLRAEAVRGMLAAVERIDDAAERLKALAALLPHAPEGSQAEIVRQAWATLRTIKDDKPYERKYETALVDLMWQLPVAFLEEAFVVLEAVPDESLRGRVVGEVSGALPDSLRVRALALVGNIADPHARRVALGGLFPYLQDDVKAEALAVARRNADQRERALQLARLTAWLPDGLRADVAREAVGIARGMGNEEERSWLLGNIAEHLPEEGLPDVLAAAREVISPGRQVRALAGIAPYVPEGLQPQVWREALAVLDKVTNPWERGYLLREMAPKLPATLQEEGLAAARAVPDELGRAEALCSLAAAMPESQHASLHTEAVEAVRQIGGGQKRAAALATLTAYFPPPLSASVALEAWRVLQATAPEQQGPDDARVWVLSKLVGHLPNDAIGEVVDEAVRLVQAMPEDRRPYAAREFQTALEDRKRGADHPPSRAATLTPDTPRRAGGRSVDFGALLRRMRESPEESRDLAVRKVIAALRDLGTSVHDHHFRLFVGSLPGGLSEEVSREVLAAVGGMTGKAARSRLLRELADRLPPAQKGEALCAALAAADRPGKKVFENLIARWQEGGLADRNRGRALVLGVLPELARHPRAELMQELAALTPLLAHVYGPEVIRETFNAVSKVSAWWP